MSKKVLANDGLDTAAVLKLQNAGYKVVTEKVEQSVLASAIQQEQYDIVLVRSATTVRKEVIDQCPGLKIIGRAGVGMDNIDVDYARSKGIQVINTPAASSQSVAELVIGSLFSVSRFFYHSYANMPVSGSTDFETLKKQYAKGVELRGKTLGIIGFGQIGKWTARYAVGLGMNVIAADPHCSNHYNLDVSIGGRNLEFSIPVVSLDELLQNSDYISLHVPKQKDGSAVLSTTEFSKMKAGVRIVNAARGGVIDEKALMEAISTNKVAAAALDVFENEPKPDTALLSSPKLALTPHIGAATLEAQERIGLELADRVIEILG
jgi:D-3-phosphoglycerate dehydrogenase